MIRNRLSSAVWPAHRGAAGGGGRVAGGGTRPRRNPAGGRVLPCAPGHTGSGAAPSALAFRAQRGPRAFVLPLLCALSPAAARLRPRSPRFAPLWLLQGRDINLPKVISSPGCVVIADRNLFLAQTHFDRLMWLNFAEDDTKISPFTAVLFSEGFYKQQVINSPGGWAGVVILCLRRRGAQAQASGSPLPVRVGSGLLTA